MIRNGLQRIICEIQLVVPDLDAIADQICGYNQSDEIHNPNDAIKYHRIVDVCFKEW